MRKFLIAIMFMLAGVHAHAAQMVNVEYIHKLIEQRWDITIPYSPKLSTPKVAANMKYLLTLVDMTNKRINGAPTTNYGDGEYATMAAADTIATNRAVAKLIKIKPKFFITTTPDTAEFEFRISAAGHFMVDWGDGNSEIITRPNVTQLETYSHTYDAPGEYKIGIGGYATEYYNIKNSNLAAVQFGSTSIYRNNLTVAKIDGSLGAIFGTIGAGRAAGQQPIFNETFYQCKKLTGQIQENLFAGITGQPTNNMFRFTFGGCSGLSGEIPKNLFAGISGKPVVYLFNGTFYGCHGLSGSIPENLFAGIEGAPGVMTFRETFWGCSGLSGPIPENLFAKIKGAPATYMFQDTFSGCRGLTGTIPDKLFAGIRGKPMMNMFYQTFVGCTGLSGCVPDGLFGDIGMTLDEIIEQYNPFSGSGVTPEYCPVTAP